MIANLLGDGSCAPHNSAYFRPPAGVWHRTGPEMKTKGLLAHLRFPGSRVSPATRGAPMGPQDLGDLSNRPTERPRGKIACQGARIAKDKKAGP